MIRSFKAPRNSQETLGRHRCLLKLREVGGDSFVHRLGLCEVWRCGTVARLKLSAGPGGALSPSLDAITLAAQGRYLTVQETYFKVFSLKRVKRASSSNLEL